MLNSSIRPIDRTQSDGTTPCQSGPGSKDNEGVLNFSQISSITGASPSDGLGSFTGHSFDGVLTLCKDAVGVFNSPSRWVKWSQLNLFYNGRVADDVFIVAQRLEKIFGLSYDNPPVAKRTHPFPLDIISHSGYQIIFKTRVNIASTLSSVIVIRNFWSSK